MPSTLPTITVRNVRYRVERIANPEAFLLPLRFVLHDPRGRRWLLGPSRERPDRLVGIAPIRDLGSFRMSPFIGLWFADEDGKLVLAGSGLTNTATASGC